MRSPSAAENQILDELLAKIQAIAAAGTLNRLEGTGVLGAPANNQQAYVDFHQRFQLLPGRLQQLRAQDRIKINPDLGPAIGANAAITKEGGQAVVTLELPEDTLADRPSSLTDRALTVVHELSHTIFEDPVYVIKDFTYRKTWAQDYLTGAIGWRNADTYAEAAAQIAGDLEHTPGRYQALGKIPARRQALRGLLAQDGLILGHALAWADIKVNRAWIRGLDYENFAHRTSGSGTWQQTQREWAADPDDSRLLSIETDLRNSKGRIIGDRHGNLTVGLSKDSLRTAKNINGYMLSLKGTFDSLALDLRDAGAAISYDPAANTLAVPRALVTGDSYTLGELIIDALVNALDYTDASDRSTASLNAHKRAIVELLVAHDRPYETGHVRTMRQQFQAAQAQVAPAQAAWDSARIDLDLATVKFTAVRMTTIGYSAEAAAGAAGPARDKLAGLGPGISADVNEAVQVGARYAAPGAPALSPAQIQTRRDNFTDALLGLGRLRNAVAGIYADQTPAYDGFLASLAPFAT
jgi:hypothetical protein